MSNIYAINPIFRRGGETVHSPGADTYRYDYKCNGYLSDATWIVFEPPTSGDGYRVFYYGGNKVTFSTQHYSFNVPVLDLSVERPRINIPGNIQSFKYVLMGIASDYNIDPTDVNRFFTKMQTLYADGKTMMRGPGKNQSLAELYIPQNMSCYPYMYEYTDAGTTITASKLTTYGTAAPNTALHGYNHTGGEWIRLSGDFNYDWVLEYNDGGGIGTVVPLADWCNAVKNKWLNYTPQLTGSKLACGFLFFYRGYNGTTATTRQLIKSFLDNCSTINTANDWTHERLT